MSISYRSYACESRKKPQNILFRHSGPPADELQPESRFFKHLQNDWTPVFTGVTAW